MTPLALGPSTLSAAIQIYALEWIAWQRWWKRRREIDLLCLIPFTFSVGGAQTVSKDLVWEGDGWLLLYKGLSESRFQWPRSPQEVHSLTPQQFR